MFSAFPAVFNVLTAVPLQFSCILRLLSLSYWIIFCLKGIHFTIIVQLRYQQLSLPLRNFHLFLYLVLTYQTNKITSVFPSASCPLAFPFGKGRGGSILTKYRSWYALIKVFIISFLYHLQVLFDDNGLQPILPDTRSWFQFHISFFSDSTKAHFISFWHFLSFRKSKRFLLSQF